MMLALTLAGPLSASDSGTTAADFLKQAGGDLAKAQALAKKAGYTWK